jgi:hypothetical protein
VSSEKEKCLVYLHLYIFVEEIVTTDKKKDSKKRSKKPKNKKQRNDSVSNCNQLEDKLKWAVNEVR